MAPLITKRSFLPLDRFGSDKEPYRNQSIWHETFHNARYAAMHKQNPDGGLA
jgi:hypothetical protein